MEELPLELSKTRALDTAGTDTLFTFGLLMNGPEDKGGLGRFGEGEIHVQIKTSCLREYKDGTRYWKFKIIRIDKELEEELWSQPNFFLGLVLVWCHPNEFTGVQPPPGTRWKKLMMSGEKVVNYFKKHEKSKHIRLYKKKYERGGYKFLEGADDLYSIVLNQMDEQTKEGLEEWRNWEEDREYEEDKPGAGER